MNMKTKLLAIAVLALCPGPALADPITYQLTGITSGPSNNPSGGYFAYDSSPFPVVGSFSFDPTYSGIVRDLSVQFVGATVPFTATAVPVGTDGSFNGILTTFSSHNSANLSFNLTTLTGGGSLFLGQFTPDRSCTVGTVFCPYLFYSSSYGYTVTGTPVSAVPGPIAGAGLPGLIFAMGALAWWRRRAIWRSSDGRR